MRALTIVVFLSVACAFAGAQQKALPEKPANTVTAFALLVGSYYVLHQRWPSSVEEFREHTAELVRQFPPDARETIPTVWSLMRQVRFTPRGKDLLVSMRFHEDGREYSYAAVLHPGRSSEEIARHMTPK